MKKKLQVFVSSTFTDLPAERQAAVSSILQAGHIPAGMELFTAGDQSQMTIIKQWIDESDVYMLILGGRYGSIDESSGLSYTELEFDYAVACGKPLFSIVVKDEALERKVKDVGTKILESENQKLLKDFRKKVTSNQCSFYDDTKDIQIYTNQSLNSFARSRDMKGWVSGSDIPDTRLLLEELKKFSDENRILKETIAELESQKVAIMPMTENHGKFKDIFAILNSTSLTIPANVIGGEKGVTRTIFSLFYNMRDMMINGVKNAPSSSSTEIFLYKSLCPKLQIHGLMRNEAVPGMMWRRSVTTPLGEQFLADYEMQKMIEKRETQD